MSQRPKKSLFSFTRKRVFDSLFTRFNGFEVSGIEKANGLSITFKYFGNYFIKIVGSPDYDFPITITTWHKDGRYERDVKVEEYFTRAGVNALLAAKFGGFDAVQNRIREIEND